MQLGLGGTGPRPALVRRTRKPRAARALGLYNKKNQLRCPWSFKSRWGNPGHAPPAVAEWLQGRPARATDKEKLHSRDPSLCLL